MFSSIDLKLKCEALINGGLRAFESVGQVRE